jgi:hypothetical protein
MQQNPYASPQATLHYGHGGAVSLITPRVLLATGRCRPWLFVLSMGCFIVLALGIVGMLTAEGDYNEKGIWVAAPVETGSLVMGGISSLVQLLCGIFFWKFGMALGKLGNSRQEGDLVAALGSELNVIRVVGIVALVYVILIAVGVAGGLALSGTGGAAAGDPLDAETTVGDSGASADTEAEATPGNSENTDAAPEDAGAADEE